MITEYTEYIHVATKKTNIYNKILLKYRRVPNPKFILSNDVQYGISDLLTISPQH